ncbi:MAG: sigma-54-dependent transcriptional regulator [Planctomycetota bacterium]
MDQLRVLIADDDRVICGMIQEIVEGLGHETCLAHSAAETLLAVEKSRPDLVLLDLRFPDCADLTTLEGILARSPSTDVIMVTAETDDLGIVRQATRLGAFDYVPKPIREEDIRIRATRVSEKRSLAKSHARAMAELTEGRQIDDIVGQSPAIQALVRQLQDVAVYDTPVVITGETGTGKELLARALHYGGPRRKEPFVSINCAALPLELTESELFGHEKGAFTGARTGRKGAFEEAGGGTIFLDEIGDMNLRAQAALLHVLERGEYRSIGGKEKKVSARVVMATNQDLETLVSGSRFRKDLYYRVNRVRLRVPPLRERKEDIPLLADHFLRLMEVKVGKGIRRIAERALEALQRYHWPGNVRELRNEIERAHIRARDDYVGLGALSPETVAARLDRGEEVDPKSLDEIQRLIDALRATGGNVTRAAEMLDVHRNTVHRWMKKYDLEAV